MNLMNVSACTSWLGSYEFSGWWICRLSYTCKRASEVCGVQSHAERTFFCPGCGGIDCSLGVLAKSWLKRSFWVSILQRSSIDPHRHCQGTDKCRQLLSLWTRRRQLRCGQNYHAAFPVPSACNCGCIMTRGSTMTRNLERVLISYFWLWSIESSTS